VCCGTKRLIDIRCPSDCAYLAAAREHPAAVVVRQRERDAALFAGLLRDLNERQSRLFWLINAFLLRYRPPDLHPLIDDDVAEAVAALAATYETSARGVIYEHRAATLSAERLGAALRPLIAQAGSQGGSAYDRDAAIVLRRIADAVRQAGGGDTRTRRGYLDLLGRVLRKPDASAKDDLDVDASDQAVPSRLILP
jgi:hypothetical protein